MFAYCRFAGVPACDAWSSFTAGDRNENFEKKSVHFVKFRQIKYFREYEQSILFNSLTLNEIVHYLLVGLL
jgi:hypothetical protein